MQQCISYRSNAHGTLPPFRSRVHASHVSDAESQIMTRQTAASLMLLTGTVAKRATFDPSANRADYRSTDESRNAQRRIISKPNRQPNELAALRKSCTCSHLGEIRLSRDPSTATYWSKELHSPWRSIREQKSPLFPKLHANHYFQSPNLRRRT